MALDWSISPIYPILQAIGRAIGTGQLYPQTLLQIRDGRDVWPDHVVTLYHRSGRELGQRKGKYFIEIEGPIHSGSWSFFSGDLEALARSTLKGDRAPE